MGKIIAVVNQKGGVGKTTTAVNLTAALAASGARVLLCDFDPQANATSGLGVEKRHVQYSTYDLVIGDVMPEKCVVRTDFGDVIPSAAALAGASVELIGMEKAPCVMDCPEAEASFEEGKFTVKLPKRKWNEGFSITFKEK